MLRSSRKRRVGAPDSRGARNTSYRLFNLQEHPIHSHITIDKRASQIFQVEGIIDMSRLEYRIASHMLDCIHGKQEVSHVHLSEYREPASTWVLAIFSSNKPIAPKILIHLRLVLPIHSCDQLGELPYELILVSSRGRVMPAQDTPNSVTGVLHCRVTPDDKSLYMRLSQHSGRCAPKRFAPIVQVREMDSHSFALKEVTKSRNIGGEAVPIAIYTQLIGNSLR